MIRPLRQAPATFTQTAAFRRGTCRSRQLTPDTDNQIELAKNICESLTKGTAVLVRPRR